MREVEGIVQSSETGLCWGTDLGKGTKTFLQNWRSPRTQWPLFLNGRCLEPPRLFLELATWPNWAIGGEGPWSGRWPLWQCSREPSRRTTISVALQQSGLYSRVSRWKPLLSKRYMKGRLEFDKRYLKDSQTMWKNIQWSDETKIEVFGLNVKHHTWRKPGTIHTVKHGGGSILLWRCYSAEGTGRLVRIERKMNRAKYREILDENLLQSTQDLRLGWRFTFQQDHDPKHTAKTTQEWLQEKSLNILEWPSQSPDLNPIEQLSRPENGGAETLPIQPDIAWENLQLRMG